MLHKPVLKIKCSKKINRIKDLPDWYSLKKYERTQQLTGIEWYEQLHIRLLCFYHFQIVEIEKSRPPIFESRKTLREDLCDSLKIIRDDPIVDLRKKRNLLNLFGSAINKTSSRNDTITGYECLAIHPTTVHELYFTESRLTKAKGNEARKYYNDAYSKTGFHTPTQAHCGWFNKSVADALKDTQATNLLLTIDTRQPDSAILSQLKKLLPTIRKIAKSPHPGKKYKSISTRELAQNSILQFLDLHIWEIENQINISDEVMAEAISHYKDISVGALRKNIRPFAQKALSHDRLDYLASQSAFENQGNH